jgi:hypothetical protein
MHTRFRQHAHIENLKTVANLTNSKDIFICIIRFHARAGYIQPYETLLKEINSHPGSEEVPPDQYEVETAALAGRNLNVPCVSGTRYPSLVAMLNRREMRWLPLVCTECIICMHIPLYSLLYFV